MKQHDAHTNIKPEASEPSENKEYAELLGPHGSGLHTSSRSTSAPSVANGADVLSGDPPSSSSRQPSSSYRLHRQHSVSRKTRRIW